MSVVYYVSAGILALVNGRYLAGSYAALIGKGRRISHAECAAICVTGAAVLNMAAGLFRLLIFDLMLLAAVTDQSERRIPNGIIITGTAVYLWKTACAIQAGVPLSELAVMALTGMAAGGGIFAFARIMCGRGIGAGDVKYFSMLGLLLGAGHVLRLTALSLLLMTVYIITGFIRGSLDRESALAMAPFALIAELILTAFRA